MTDTFERLKSALAARYSFERELGSGGMATVYLAHDVKHDRKVAIKVLRPELAAVLGAERFVQEIKTTASLQHPHILPLHDSGEADGFLYYVMPYIEGETLRDKLNRETQLGIEESIKITTEVADALDYAHRHNVIHRDIKPENILLHDGRPMVADFGIALAVSAAAGGRMTETGLSLGTPHYMSPEQATADKDLTNRSDIYSLGAMLYEMLTGDPPHTGSSAQQIIMKIVTEEAAPVTDARKSVPPNVAAAVAKALEKLPADRFASAGEFADVVAGRLPIAATWIGGAPAPGGGSRRWVVPVMTVLTVTAVGWASWTTLKSDSPSGRTPFRWDIVLPDSLPIALEGPTPYGIWKTALAVSPDGQLLAYASPAGETTRLTVRRADDKVSVLPSTAGAYFPVFSPDGLWIAFVSRGRLMKVRASGGTPITLHEEVGFVEGLLWTEDGRILVTLDLGLGWVPESGGVIEPFAITPSLPLTRFGDFTLLPGGKWALGTMMITGQIAALSLETGSLRAITLGGTVPIDSVSWTDALLGAAPRYSSGYLTYLSNGDGVLLAVPFDVERLEVTGRPFPVLDDVRRESPLRYGQYAISSDGTLFYAPGRNEEFGLLGIVGRDGTIDTLPFPRAQYHGVHMSPDGQRIAAFEWSETVGGSGIKILDVPTGAVERVPLEPGHHYATGAWTPSGDSLAIKRYSPITSQGLGVLFYRVSDRAVLDFTKASSVSSMVFLPDGSAFLWAGLDETANLTSLRTGNTTTGPILGWNLAISPDGKVVAFVRGRDASIGVTEFPLTPNWTPVVADGNPDGPQWAPGGRSLIYRDIRTFKEVDVTISDGRVTVSEPRVIAHGPFTRTFHNPHSVTPDGRILVVLGSGATTAPRLRVVTHFDATIARHFAQDGGTP